jgi:leucyl aminopeptidase (aminopeptidase T)
MTIDRIFGTRERVIILYDLPVKDSREWKWRRDYAGHLYNEFKHKGVDTKLAAFQATETNNADLPQRAFAENKEIPMIELIRKSTAVIALTEFSATAPLKAFAKEYGIKAVSMPGFTKEMIPALEIDYNEVAKKVSRIFDILKDSKSAKITFMEGKYELFVDLRNREPKKDDGMCHEKGTVINMPSGEAFIVPYEGEDSRTEGYLPIEENGELAVYKVKANRIISSEPYTSLMRRIEEDPAVGNIAELAFGVLGEFGIKPCGKVLLDEKLGMHIALGRSEHLGGTTSPASFKKKENVWHQDFVYIKEMQPGVSVSSCEIECRGCTKILI